jgi:hypothetical protein
MYRVLFFLGLVLAVALSTLGFVLFPYWEAANNVRHFEVERGLFSLMTMNPYRSLVIRSDKELKQTIDDLKTSIKPLVIYKQDEDCWLGRCRAFGESIRQRRPDFEKESLVLILTSGYSSSTDVGLSMPHLRQGRLVCNIWISSPPQCLRDWVQRGFVLIVQNDMVAEVEVCVRGKQKEILQVARRRGE